MSFVSFSRHAARGGAVVIRFLSLRGAIISVGFRLVARYESPRVFINGTQMVISDMGRAPLLRVEDGSGQHLIAKHFTPVDKALVGSDDEAGALVAARHQPKKRLASSRLIGRYSSSSATRPLVVIHCASCHSSRFSAVLRQTICGKVLR